MVDVGIQVSTGFEPHNWINRILHNSRQADQRNFLFDKEHFITRNYVERIFLFQKQKCFHCEKNMQVWHRKRKDGCTIERLNNKKGHTIKNCVLACMDCNRRISGGRPKNTKDTKMFFRRS